METKQSKTITTGLVLGKFAPLHKGHQLLIEKSLQEMDRTVVMIYDCPEVINVSLNKRADWIRKLYPQAIVIEAYNSPKEEGRSKIAMRAQEKYALGQLSFPITHFYSSEWYGEHMSKALSAKNVIVDLKRIQVPISGTLIRSDPYRYRKFVEPIVYQDLIVKVVFLGAESTGKSTIAETLAKDYKTKWMPEYGREYWDKYHDISGKLSLEQLADLAREHIEKENQLIYESRKYFFVDTNTITTEMFSRFYHNAVHPDLIELAKQAETRYDLWFVCGTDIPYEDDGTRSGKAHRIKFQQQIIDDLKKRNIKFTLLEGNLESRIRQVQNQLKKIRI